MRLWVTRTQPGAVSTADALRQAGHAPVVQPVLEYRPLPSARIDLTGAQALAFTSRNAVEQFARLSYRRDLPVFAPGEGTAAAARAAGFREVQAAHGAVPELAGLIARSCPGGRVVWPGPAEPAGDLVGLLAAEGVEVLYTPIYETAEVGAPAPTDVDGVLIHSPKGARAVAGLLSRDQASGLIAFVISAAAAAPVAKLPFQRVAVAPRPSETALLGLIAG